MSTKNLLAREMSPYLLQHKDNPVEWYPWGEDAFGRARQEDKPVLLSIGYAACHWCHVMARESFEEGETVEMMNSLFINIKVDREERPDLDRFFQHALMAMGDHGGWPLTMFLTPEGLPFWGGTYFPNTQRWGKPAFKTVLTKVARLYREDPFHIKQQAQALKEFIQQQTEPPLRDDSSASFPTASDLELSYRFDPIYGGFKGAPKFPETPLLQFLWSTNKTPLSALSKKHVTLTLEQMSRGGIYDHLGGGYYRYATDEKWLIPHFEKMLYDNALLIEALAQAWQGDRNPLFQQRLEETVNWLLLEMSLPEGGFASSLNAESEGNEGQYYIWREEEIDATLGSASKRFKSVYGVTAQGNWEGYNILNQLKASPEDLLDPQLLPYRLMLFEKRGQRTPPSLDDKVLADWNGFLIAALAYAGCVFNDKVWLERAERAYTFICEFMSEGRFLKHSWRGGRDLNIAFLEDYAAMIKAALTLFQVTGKQGYLKQAEEWEMTTHNDYWDFARGGGYFQTSLSVTDTPARLKDAADGAVPSGNALMAENLVKLYYLTGKDEYRQRFEALQSVFAATIQQAPLHHGTFLKAIELFEDPYLVALITPKEEQTGNELIKEIFQYPLPRLILYPAIFSAAIPPKHFAAGKLAIEGEISIYICKEGVCLAPLTTKEELKAHLEKN